MYFPLRVCCSYDFFSLLGKITIMPFEQNKPIIKILIKDIAKS